MIAALALGLAGFMLATAALCGAVELGGAIMASLKAPPRRPAPQPVPAPAMTPADVAKAQASLASLTAGQEAKRRAAWLASLPPPP